MTNPILIRVCLRGAGGDEYVTVLGEPAPYGLVVHPRVQRRHGKTLPDFYTDWTISEPTTGFKVAGGRSRDEALTNLAIKVEVMGGPERFQASVRAGIEEVMRLVQKDLPAVPS